MTKCVVLDTNVFIENPKCIFDFPGEDIIIPITVLEELDSLKMNKDYELRVKAQRCAHVLDDITETDEYIENGYAILSNDSKIIVSFIHDNLADIDNDKPDNKIIACAVSLKNEYSEVCLVSKDINVRTKSRQYKIKSTNYNYFEEELKNIDTGIINKYVSSDNVINARNDKSCRVSETLRYNQHVLLTDENNNSNVKA